MDKLKTCPFCGAIPEIKYQPTDNIYLISCKNKDCKISVNTWACNSKQEAIEAWNTRKGENLIENNIQAVAEVLGLNKGEENGQRN